MQAMSLNVIAVFLGIMLSSSVPVYADVENDARLLKCFNKIEKNEKNNERRRSSRNYDKRQWGEKAEMILIKAKQAFSNKDGIVCLNFVEKTRNMRKYGYEE